MAQHREWILEKDDLPLLSIPPPPPFPPPPLSSSPRDVCQIDVTASGSASSTLSSSSSLMHHNEEVVPGTDHTVVKRSGKRRRDDNEIDTVSTADPKDAEDMSSSLSSSLRLPLETKKNEEKEREALPKTATFYPATNPLEREMEEEKKEVVRTSCSANPSTIPPDGVSPSTHTLPSHSSALPSSTSSAAPPSATEKTTHARKEEDEDLSFAILGEHELKMLSLHKGIRSALRDSRLQSMIRCIDRSQCKLETLQLALQNDPCFKEFYDTTLSVIREAQMERASKPYFYART